MTAPAEATGKLFEEGWSRIRGSTQGLQGTGRSFGIMRTGKIKTLGNMGASLQHTFRERETPNADPDRLKDNTILVGAATSKEVLAVWKDRAPEKIRSNAVHGLEYFIGGSPEKMQAMNRNEQDAYFRDALGWIEDRHGKENVLSAVIHRDETTPHMTVMTIPLDRQGKLNCRSFVGNKKMLSELQSDFATRVSERHGLQRGIKGSTARHERVQRVYGAYMTEKYAVELPERVRGSLLGRRGESDAEWHARATEAATDALSALELRMKRSVEGADARMQVAASMVENLQALKESYKAQLDGVTGKLDRLVASLELAGLAKETNTALGAYGELETRIEKGDLAVLEEAKHSLPRIQRIANICDRVFPNPEGLTEDQARFDGALEVMLNAISTGDLQPGKDTTRIGIERPPLPYVEKALAHLAEDRITPPFSSHSERMAFRAEVETYLTANDLEALRQGEVGVLEDILDRPLSEADHLRLALAYFDQGEVTADQGVRLGIIEKLAEIEYGQVHGRDGRGPIHS